MVAAGLVLGEVDNQTSDLVDRVVDLMIVGDNLEEVVDNMNLAYYNYCFGFASLYFI
jgi:hypothetical protein